MGSREVWSSIFKGTRRSLLESLIIRRLQELHGKEYEDSSKEEQEDCGTVNSSRVQEAFSRDARG